MNQEKLKKINYPSTLRHSLGYLPTILLKAIIEDKILDKKDSDAEIKFPKSFSFHTTSLFIDISHFFDKNYNKNNKNKTNKENDEENSYNSNTTNKNNNHLKIKNKNKII